MNPQFSRPMRASIVGRARFIEDLVEEKVNQGISQYVILGEGLDTFAQRRPEFASRLQVFEVDQLATQQWKRHRLQEFGFDPPSWLHFIPVDLEIERSGWGQFISSGFDPSKPAIVVSTGVSMYLGQTALREAFQRWASLSPGSVFASTFMLPLELLSPEERSLLAWVMDRARQSGTPFLSLFHPEEIQSLAHTAGFKKTRYIPAKELYQRYFAQRSDGLRAGDAEVFLVAET